MKCGTRRITKDQYERAVNNNGYLTDEDRLEVFTEAERCGYGIYDTRVYTSNGLYLVNFEKGSSCD